MWNLRNKTNEQREGKREPKNRLLPIENKLMDTKGEVGGGWVKGKED